MPIASGRPRCTGAPCTEGKREVIWIARIASAGVNGRIDTTSGPAKRAGRHAADIGAVHRDVRAAGHMAQLDPLLDQRLLERKRAAEREADEIVAPDMANIGRFLDQLAVAPHPVFRQIGADVEILAQSREARVARLGHRQHRAGLWVGLCKPQKIMRQRLWQDDQVRLDIAGGEPRGRAGKCHRLRMRMRARAPASMLRSIAALMRTIHVPGDRMLLPAHGGRQSGGCGRRNRSGIVRMSAVYLAIAILLEISGTTALKLSDGFTRPGPAGAVVVCYIAELLGAVAGVAGNRPVDRLRGVVRDRHCARRGDRHLVVRRSRRACGSSSRWR